MFWYRGNGVKMVMDAIFKKDLIYIGGKLNDDAPGYIRNLSDMAFVSIDLKENYDLATICPGNDFIEGLVDGCLTYDDYLKNTREQLRRCDALFLMYNWKDSKGAVEEVKMANLWGIPVFENLKQLTAFLNRPKILAITGKSGTGKTTIAQYIEDTFKIKMIESHTDRPKRHPEEVGHTFHTKEEYDQLNKEDMIAYTNWNGNRYCCLKEDVLDENVYVIDEKGLTMMEANYKHMYKIFKLHIDRDIILRLQNIDSARYERDDEYFYLPETYYDEILYNNGSIHELETEIDSIIKGFF